MRNAGMSFFLLIAQALTGSGCLNPVKGSNDLWSCAVDFQIPRITDGLEEEWLAGKKEAQVTAKFTISKQGRATNLKVVSPTPELQRFASKFILQSEFSPKCNGLEVGVTFEFQLLRRPVAMDLPAISLRSDNTVRIVLPLAGPSAPLRFSTEPEK